MENERDFYQELDDLAEVDQNNFWAILNRKKSPNAVKKSPAF